MIDNQEQSVAIGRWWKASEHSPAGDMKHGLYWTRDIKNGRRSAKMFEYWPGMKKDVWRHENSIIEADPNSFEWLEEPLPKEHE